jgi:hypothetical protein
MEYLIFGSTWPVSFLESAKECADPLCAGEWMCTLYVFATKRAHWVRDTRLSFSFILSGDTDNWLD